jgi:hypothetical protein
MPSLTRVMILYVGQGMMTLVEIYSNGVAKPAADYLALIDAGGSSDKAADAVDYVVTKILAKADKKLDLVSISHQDGDHVTLLKSLAEKLTGKGVTCGRIFAGGSGWSSARAQTVKDFAKVVGIVPERSPTMARCAPPSRTTTRRASSRTSTGPSSRSSRASSAPSGCSPARAPGTTITIRSRRCSGSSTPGS